MGYQDVKEQNAQELFDRGVEIQARFFFHWSLLSAGTLALLMPLVLSVSADHGMLVRITALKIGAVLLVLALVLSSLRNYHLSRIMIEMHGYMSADLNKMAKNYNFWTKSMKRHDSFQSALALGAIFGYVVGMIMLLIFLFGNIDADVRNKSRVDFLDGEFNALDQRTSDLEGRAEDLEERMDGKF